MYNVQDAQIEAAIRDMHDVSENVCSNDKCYNIINCPCCRVIQIYLIAHVSSSFGSLSQSQFISLIVGHVVLE